MLLGTYSSYLIWTYCLTKFVVDPLCVCLFFCFVYNVFVCLFVGVIRTTKTTLDRDEGDSQHLLEVSKCVHKSNQTFIYITKQGPTTMYDLHNHQ